MRFLAVIWASLLVVLVSAYEQAGITDRIQSRKITATLFLNNPFDAGDWGIVEICPDESFSHAFEVLFYPPGAVDETAVNAVRLYCSHEDGHDTGYVQSASGPEGSWYGMKICTEDFITGFRAKVLDYEGVFTDDVAVQDVEVECKFGAEILQGIYDTQSKYNEGTWSVWAQCPVGSAVCGLQTRVEPPQLADDDTAVTDINLFCCERTPANTTAPAV